MSKSKEWHLKRRKKRFTPIIYEKDGILFDSNLQKIDLQEEIYDPFTGAMYNDKKTKEYLKKLKQKFG
jgi:hypothetical protein